MVVQLAAILCAGAMGCPDLVATRLQRAPDPPAQQLPLYDLSEARRRTVRLPAVLREISGLAVDGRGRLFAHEDETARVYRLDPATGSVLQTIEIGPERTRGDFEGLAVAGDRFFMITGGATLIEFREPAAGKAAQYRSVATGLERECETEGLAYDAATASLLIPCKTTLGRERDDRVLIFAAPVATLRADPRPRVSLPHADLAAAGLERAFHASSIEVHPRTGSFFLVSAQEEEVIEISRDGRLLAGARLSRRVHPQPEGITFGPGLELWISDEGGDGRGSLTTYRLKPAPPRGVR